jgi:hypothetical protein
MTRSNTRLPEVIVEAIDLLTRFSIPLYVHDASGRPEQYGTGFFVRADTTHLLVSAAHVLDVGRTRKTFFYAAPDKLRYLTGRVLTTGSLTGAAYDPLDVAVMRLTGEAVPPFPDVDKFAMDIAYLKPSYQPRSGKHYAIIGFPATKSRVDTAARTALVSAYAYRSDSIDDAAYDAHGVHAATHVVLPLDLRRGFDVTGRTVTFPKPHGMSGSPVIVLYDVDETAAHSSRVFPVVGVGIEYRKRTKVLVATDVHFVLEMIAQHLRA